MAPVPARRLGWTLGPSNADVNLACFLDYTCPFCTKQYKTLREVVYPKYANRSFSLTVYQMPQPWHPQSTICHEAALAVGKIGGSEAFYKFSDQLFEKAQDNFYDAQTFDMTRNQIVDKLAALAAESGAASAEEVKAMISMVANSDKKNAGTQVTQDIKYYVKFARQNGIHVSPTCTLNGLVFDSSSSWQIEDWDKLLEPLF
uniref:Thioredoxin-like protein n=1 Tax=Tetraselmis sp. GSL018 TaxID=582737 RepID=A0A061S123_9CHLO|mmetsp:Transcript_17028/g.40625  ORF Transcript_17028/g.40625 Transcript_17028/m.40625 type:complete len:202 (-) Transcript_17028:155-760(-)